MSPGVVAGVLMHRVVDMDSGADLLAANRRISEENKHKLSHLGIRAFDFMGSIGSGKTLLIEGLVDELVKKNIRPGVIAGDVAGEDDCLRFQAHGVPVANVNTGKECHLDSHLVDHALEELPLPDLDVLFIENVGNLVCPADFPLGTEKRVVVVSVTEGDDMVRKHPIIFGCSDVIVINKVGLADAIGVDPNILVEDANRIAPHTPVVLTDAKSGTGILELIGHLGL